MGRYIPPILSRAQVNRAHDDATDASLDRPVPDVPCRYGTSAFCVPFAADDVVRFFYKSSGVAFIERCIHCGRVIVAAAPR